MNFQNTLVLGIVSGIITSFLIWFLVNFFKNIVVPWFESIVYKGIDISGDWQSSVTLTPSHFRVNLDINIKQKGHRLNGDIHALYINTLNEKERRTRRLKFTGKITDNNIVITYNSATKTVVSLGVFLLKQHLGGEQLKGTMVSSDRVTNGILSYEDITWKRNDL
ncbi:hypothetical protein K6L05_00470 [Salinicoccus roseus]|uniref:hypothetical protein n=1 Tax=Salinicoccus roseus TaxID=45670 RepID=UPI001CA755E8|nr:hypothetical protein [Salinicoccus roseus]MBY8908257.1 hypothetical protein [Salinicoccus roseus]